MASIFPQCDSRLLDAIRNASGAIIVAHKNPDGDAIASSLAMAAILERMGKRTELLNDGPFLRGDIRRFEDRFRNEASDEFISTSPLVIVLDCSTPDRPGDAFRRISDLDRIVIDHHSSGVPFAAEGMSYIVPESPSTTLCINDHIIDMSINPEIRRRVSRIMEKAIRLDLYKQEVRNFFQRVSNYITVNKGLDKMSDGEIAAWFALDKLTQNKRYVYIEPAKTEDNGNTLRFSDTKLYNISADSAHGVVMDMVQKKTPTSINNAEFKTLADSTLYRIGFGNVFLYQLAPIGERGDFIMTIGPKIISITPKSNRHLYNRAYSTFMNVLADGLRVPLLRALSSRDKSR